MVCVLLISKARFSPRPVTCIYWFTCFVQDLFSCFSEFLQKSKKKQFGLWCNEINTALLLTGVNLHHDVQNALSEDTGHCYSSQLWWGKLQIDVSTKPLIVWNWASISFNTNIMGCVVLSGPKLLAALLAGHAAAHAARPRLPNGGEHCGCLWLHPLQGHLWGADAHRPASTAWQVSICCNPHSSNDDILSFLFTFFFFPNVKHELNLLH